MAFDIKAAKNAGYSDDEILDHLTQSRKFDIQGAINSGYSKQEIIDHLSSTTAIKPPQQQQKLQEKGLGRKVVDFFTGAEQAFGNTLGAAASVIDPEVNKNRDAILKQSQQQVDSYMKLAKSTNDKNKKKKYLEAAKQAADTSGLDIFNNPEYQKTAKQVFGEGLGVALDIASAGTYGNAAKAMKTGQLAAKVAENAIVKPVVKSAGEAFVKGALKEAPAGIATGVGYGVSNAMQQDKSLGEIATQGIEGGIMSGILSGVIGGFSAKNKFLAPEKAQKLKDQAVAQYQRGLNAGKEKYKQSGEKIIPELLDNKVWGTFRGLMKKADDGISMSEKEYEKLGELQGIIGTSDILVKIDDKMSKMLRPDGSVMSVNQTAYKQLEHLKDDILAYNTKDFIAGNSIETMTAEQQKLRELAQNYGRELYDTRKSMKTINDSKTLSQVKYVDGAIRDLLNTKNPEYAKINKIYHLNSELKDILIDTAQRKNSHQWINIIRTMAGGSGLTAGSMMGGLPGGIIGGMTNIAVAEILNSTWYNTLRAVQKNELANKILAKSEEEIAPTILLMARQGGKYAQKLLNE